MLLLSSAFWSREDTYFFMTRTKDTQKTGDYPNVGLGGANFVFQKPSLLNWNFFIKALYKWLEQHEEELSVWILQLERSSLTSLL